MKIISWNCHGKFREKHKLIEPLDADIYVIQECEDPQQTKDTDYARFAKNSIWYGNNKSKGLGVFAKKGILIEDNNWEAHYLRHFLSVKVNGDFDLLAVWACSPYIEEYCVYQSINFKHYTEDMVIMGDFNSNKKWDRKHDQRSHTAVLEKLEALELHSAYHALYEEEQGEETTDTFYMYRHIDKGYHIDYAFLNKARMNSFRIYDKEIWLQHSDHMPIALDFS